MADGAGSGAAGDEGDVDVEMEGEIDVELLASGLSGGGGRARSGLGAGSSDFGAFAAGSVCRVEVKDFMTYSACTFHPKPRLNLIVGPNGE